jgi:pyruvate kinase
MGPKCAGTEDSLGKLLDAGMNVMRMNFSHGDHSSHLEVLERFRKARPSVSARVPSRCACSLFLGGCPRHVR